MSEYLGVEVPDDAHGVLQDVHWSRGTLGYFPTYALGNVISVQIWERVLADVPDLDEQIERGDLTPLTTGSASTSGATAGSSRPPETLERVVGGGLDPEPYLRYLTRSSARSRPERSPDFTKLCRRHFQPYPSGTVRPWRRWRGRCGSSTTGSATASRSPCSGRRTTAR